MPPGREIDALVAEKVMGLVVISDANKYLEIMENGGDFFGKKYVCTILCHNQTFDKHRAGHTIAILPHYSTNITSVWAVVEKLLPEYEFELAKTRQKYVAIFIGGPDETGEHPIFRAQGDTAPHAICLASLKAVGVKV